MHPIRPMGKTLNYAYKLWPRLRRYALDGRYHIDNNSVERNQRPSVMGRKNYVFNKSDGGAVDNAIFYSLIESCEIAGVNPLQWHTHVLQSLHDDTTAEQITQMLPYNYRKTREWNFASFLIQSNTAYYGWLRINKMEKAACFGWLRWQHSSSSLPKYDTYTNKKASVTIVTKALREKGRLPTLPHCIAVPSAQVGLTSLFGMGRGGTPPQ